MELLGQLLLGQLHVGQLPWEQLPGGQLKVGSNPVAILPSYQNMKIIALWLHIYIYIYMGSKNKKHLRVSTQATIHPLAIILNVA